MSGLSDELIASMLRQAEEDTREGRLVHCANEEDVRKFFVELRSH